MLCARFLDIVQDIITKRHLTTDKDKINAMLDRVDLGACLARNVIMNDYFKTCKS